MQFSILTFDPTSTIPSTRPNDCVNSSCSVEDALGRRMQQGATTFLYIDKEEIGAYKQGKPAELKIPALSTPVAIEINGRPYAPITDVQGTIRMLIDWKSGQIITQNHCDAFGAGLTEEIPYAYAGKRYDPKTGLLYFGKRYYDPTLRRWLTPDPAGSIDHSNLYQYVFNNPCRYVDPTGEFVFAIPLLYFGAELVLPSLTACVTAAIYGAAAGAAVYGGYKLVEAINEASIQTYYLDGPSLLYVPDRPLPRDEDGVPIPDVDAPHTQLGTKESTRKKGEKYPQAREFDAQGTPVRDIDFTDHDTPNIHPNPHQHRHTPNPTGGTPKRENAEPLPEWIY